MPLLKGKFRPATSLARSHSNSEAAAGSRPRSDSTSSGVRPRSDSTSSGVRPRSDSTSSDHAGTVSVTVLQPATSHTSAFKVPTAPIVVGTGPIVVGLASPKRPTHQGLASPKRPAHQTLFCPSPRKIPTTPHPCSTPFSPGRPHSPHFIQPPYQLPDTALLEHARVPAELDVVNNVVVVTSADLSEQPIKTEQHAEHTEQERAQLQELQRDAIRGQDTGHVTCSQPIRGQDTGHVTHSTPLTVIGDDSSVTGSVISYEEDDEGGRPKKKKKERSVQGILEIDKSVMTIADIINQRTPKSAENPLTKIWVELKEKEQRDADLDAAKLQSKKDRTQQLIEEAEARGEMITEHDIDEHDLPPLEVELDEEGNIVVNAASLEVKMNSNTDIHETVEEDDTEITFGKYEDHKVSINSYSRRKRAISAGKWSDHENNRFYIALRKVGTDFDLMTKLMPEYTRDQLKRKFKREEKLRLAKVDMALKYSMALDDKQLESEKLDPDNVCNHVCNPDHVCNHDNSPPPPTKPAKKQKPASKRRKPQTAKKTTTKPKKLVVRRKNKEFVSMFRDVRIRHNEAGLKKKHVLSDSDEESANHSSVYRSRDHESKRTKVRLEEEEEEEEYSDPEQGVSSQPLYNMQTLINDSDNLIGKIIL